MPNSMTVPTEGDFERIAAVVKRVEALPSGEEVADSRSPLLGNGPVRVVLLQSLVNGLPALARITRYQIRPVADVALFGVPSQSGGQIQLRIGRNGETFDVPAFPMYATAGEVKSLIESVVNTPVSVGLGAAIDSKTGDAVAGQVIEPFSGVSPSPDLSGEPYNPGRWLIDLHDWPDATLTAASWPNSTNVIIRPTNWVDVGLTRRVHLVIPLGDPTPLSPGCVCVCQRVDGVLCVVAAEARLFRPLVPPPNPET